MTGHEIEDGKNYYIMDARQVVGNCALWWAKEDKGYTCEIRDAGIYTAEEARRRTRRETDIPFEVDAVKACVVQHVRVEALRRIG